MLTPSGSSTRKGLQFPFLQLRTTSEILKMGVLSNKIDKENLEPGDHIYSWRAAHTYAHHGIYIGGGHVIHFTRRAGAQGLGIASLASSMGAEADFRECARCGVPPETRHGVMLQCLDCFLFNGDLYRFEYERNWAEFLLKVRGGTCSMARVDPPMDVLHRARYLLEHGFGDYNVFSNNCEDFAVYCKTGMVILDKTGVGGGGQAAAMAAAPFAAALAAPLRSGASSAFPLGTIVIGIGVYCLGRYSMDMGVRKDVVKLDVETLVQNLRHR